jgi:hypothetical protein
MPVTTDCARVTFNELRLKLVGNEANFTLEAETLFRPYLPSDFN